MIPDDLRQKLVESALHGFISEAARIEGAEDVAARFAAMPKEDQAKFKQALAATLDATLSTLAAEGQAIVPVEPWQPIETAPKDGSIILAYRPPAKHWRGERLIAVIWNDEMGEWIWPEEPHDEYSIVAYHKAVDDGDTCSSNRFTHWRPLPVPPLSAPVGNSHDR